jgi:hypothetical protein
MQFFRILIGVVLLFSACKGGLSEAEKRAFREELEQREVKRVTPGEVTEAVFQQGNRMADTLYQLFLSKDMDTKSLRTSVITAEDDPLLDSLNRKYKVHIKWIGADVASDTPVVTTLEKQLLDAYLYNIENGEEVRENVQRIDEKSFLFTQPLHSNEIKTSSSESLQLGGMWSITLSQREVILAL